MVLIGKAISKEEYEKRILNYIQKEKLEYEFLGFDKNFIGIKTKIKLYCKKHDYVFCMSINNFFQGKRCTKCSGCYRYSEEERIEQIKNRIVKENLNYVFLGMVDKYKNNNSKFKLHCNICNYEWDVSISKFLGNKKSKCPICQKNPRYTIEDRINQINNIIQKENLPYDFNGFLGEYHNSNTKLNLFCKIHNKKWSPTINDFVNNFHRCPLCCNKSHGEILIENILKEYKINYIREYSFEDCKYKKKLFFDFFIQDKNCCIEYDGIQHFSPTTFGGINNNIAEKNLKECMNRDHIKNEYCKKNNIKLIRIKYTYNENKIRQILQDL